MSLTAFWPITHYFCGQIITIASIYEPLLINIYNKNLRLYDSKIFYLEYGSKNCINYDSSRKTPFEAITQSVCLRKCFISYCHKILRCNPLIFNELITSLDNEGIGLSQCTLEELYLCQNLSRNNTIFKKCHHYCPTNCLVFEVQAKEKQFKAKDAGIL